MKQEIIISQDLLRDVAEAIARCPHDRIFVLTDTTTVELCWPIIKALPEFETAQMIMIGATDEHKTLESLAFVWRSLQEGGASRHSLLINVGGGMVTDLGGFAASTFKRGLAYINIPTTLLSQVDASVGGKTGINFGGLKNEIGVFNCAQSVILSSEFLRSLDQQNLLSGYAEMLKHGLIGRHADVRQDSSAASDDEAMWAELLTFDIESPDLDVLSRMIRDSVDVKERIVSEDPHEKGLRKALNFGHTIGHAIESVTALPHGVCVALGMLPMVPPALRARLERINARMGLPTEVQADPEAVYAALLHDKKMNDGRIMAVFVETPGQYTLRAVPPETLRAGIETVVKG